MSDRPALLLRDGLAKTGAVSKAFVAVVKGNRHCMKQAGFQPGSWAAVCAEYGMAAGAPNCAQESVLAFFSTWYFVCTLSPESLRGAAGFAVMG